MESHQSIRIPIPQLISSLLISLLLILNACSNSSNTNSKKTSKPSSSSAINTNPNLLPTGDTTNSTSTESAPNDQFDASIKAYGIVCSDQTCSLQSSRSLLNIQCEDKPIIFFKNLRSGMSLTGQSASFFHPSCAADVYNVSCEFSRGKINLRPILSELGDSFTLEFISNSETYRIQINCS